MAVTQRTQYVCDRCGWDSEKTPRQPRDDFGDLTVQWNGSIGGYSCMGDSAGTTLKDKAWLCLECTRDFLAFINQKAGDS